MRNFGRLVFAGASAFQASFVFPAFAGPYEITMDVDGRTGGPDWIMGLAVAAAVVYGLLAGSAKIKIVLGLGVVLPVALMYTTGNPLWLFGIYVLPFVVAALLDRFDGRKGRADSSHD